MKHLKIFRDENFLVWGMRTYAWGSLVLHGLAISIESKNI